jgi:diguanylate cyclase (GGDEF)-like protein
MSRKIDLLKKIEMFSGLTKKELTAFSRLCKYVDYRKNSYVFKKGDESSSFFIVAEGEIAIIDKSSDKDEQILAHFIPGEIFGEFDLFEDDRRTAYAVASKKTRLLRFPAGDDDVDIAFRKNPGIFAKICYSLITINAGRIRHTNKLVTEKTSWIEDLKERMLKDKLTGFYNKSYLDEELPSLLADNKEQMSLLVVKPDDFKTINDTFGHEAGDKALIEISETVRSRLDESGIPVRFRGNEFIVLYMNTGLQEALKRAEELHKILSSIDIGMIIGDKNLTLTYSFGLAVYPDNSDTIDELIELAYSRMFKQRDRGGNGIQYIDDNDNSSLDFLKTVKAFSSLHLAELKSISAFIEPQTIAEGEALCREGDEGQEMFIIETGKTEVTIQMQDGSAKKLTEFKEGDFFGEMAIFEDAKRSATCTALEESRVLKLNKSDFHKLMKKHPYTAIKVMREMLDITSHRLTNTSRFVSEMVRWGEEASKRAITDELTGLYNRRYLDTSLEEEFHKSEKNNTPLSLIMVDLDFFREVNEQYSHEIGDEYIVEVSKVFKKHFRDSDIVSRYGGDEFTIILPDTGLKAAFDVAEKIRKYVEKIDFLKKHKGPDIKLSTSQGIAAFPENSADLKSLKELADKALYRAKETGRNRVVCWENDS